MVLITPMSAHFIFNLPWPLQEFMLRARKCGTGLKEAGSEFYACDGCASVSTQ